MSLQIRQVHKLGHVILEETMGNELSIVNSARVSFNGESTALTERDMGLLNFLMRERHATPFERIVFTFDIKCPLFVAREWQRHRISSYNELSARYSPIPMEFYTPEKGSIREQHGKPGDYYFLPVEDEALAEEVTRMIQESQAAAFSVYEDILSKGIAKEVARTVLPVGMYTRFKWTINLRSLLNFLSLRNHKHAQEEIRAYAVEVEAAVTEEFPFIMEKWNEHGRMPI